MSGRAPLATKPGGLHVADQHYFQPHRGASSSPSPTTTGATRRTSPSADIVLLGVSRSSKTPLSIYLSQQGYKVANIPLDLHHRPASPSCTTWTARACSAS